MVSGRSKGRFEPGWDGALFAALFTLLALVIFRELLSPDRILLSTDDNLGQMAYLKRGLPQSFDLFPVRLPG